VGNKVWPNWYAGTYKFGHTMLFSSESDLDVLMNSHQQANWTKGVTKIMAIFDMKLVTLCFELLKSSLAVQQTAFVSKVIGWGWMSTIKVRFQAWQPCVTLITSMVLMNLVTLLHYKSQPKMFNKPSSDVHVKPFNHKQKQHCQPTSLTGKIGRFIVLTWLDLRVINKIANWPRYW